MLYHSVSSHSLLGNVYRIALIIVSTRSFILFCTHTLVKRERKIRLLRLFGTLSVVWRPHCQLKSVKVHHLGSFSQLGKLSLRASFQPVHHSNAPFLGVC